MYGLARGMSMLVGAAIAGVLLWLATQVQATTTPAYWAFIGLIAGAGLVLALSQIAGGWTKWGRPRVTAAAFLLGFLPALLVGGWILLAAQPPGSWLQATTESWATQLALGGTLEAMTAVLPAIAFALGLLFGFSFDTTGTHAVVEEPVATTAPARVEDEPVASERTAVHEAEEERIEEEHREPDRDFVGSLSGRDRRGDVEVREDGDTRRVEREHEEPRRGLFRRR